MKNYEYIVASLPDITTGWTLRFDADERLTPELCEELRQLMAQHAQDDVTGVTMEAWLYFMGKKIRHGDIVEVKGVGRVEVELEV